MIIENTDAAGLLAQLVPWLTQYAPQIGQPIDLTKFSVGQSNPTYELVTEKGHYVLRTQPVGVLLKSAHAVDREFRVMAALDGTAVPVPKMIAECSDTDVIGRKFFVMEKVAGQAVFDPALADYNAADRARLYHKQTDILAALAMLDPVAIGLDGFGKPAGYMDRQFSTWTRQYRASQTKDLADMEFLITHLGEALEETLPGLCVIHGDFRLDNMLLQNGTDIQALIDWELSTLGPAFVDLSYWCAMLRMDHDWPIGGLGGIDRATFGIPAEDDLVQQFCHQTGYDKPANWDALIAFQCFRFAAILQGVLKRHLDGNASASNAASVGSQVAPMAILGARILRGYLGAN